MDGILSVAFGTTADLQTKEEKDTFSEKVDTFFRPTPIFAVFGRYIYVYPYLPSVPENIPSFEG